MRVLEMGIAIQGPAAALMLSDLGAVRPSLAALALPRSPCAHTFLPTDPFTAEPTPPSP